MTECCRPTTQDLKMLNPKKNTIIAAVILVDADKRILIAKRPAGKIFADYWEFPGGKIEENEAPQISLKRELKEELGIDVCTGCLSPVNFISHSYDNFHLVMLLFSCRNWEGVPYGVEGQELKWVKIQDLKNYNMPEANKAIIPYIKQILT